jgi:hypothetical protein
LYRLTASLPLGQTTRLAWEGQQVKGYAYIDGFNLYYGIKKWPAYKWLDIPAMLDALFPNDEIGKVRYFTANVKGKGNPQSPIRQNSYLRALASVPRVEILRSRFLVSDVYMRKFAPPHNLVHVFKTEEKGSDVNLATYLLLDAFRRESDFAIVVSNDSDLKEPIRLVQQPPFNVPVTVFNPFRPFKADMAAARHLELKVADVRDHQFPDQVGLPNGKVVTRPATWH